MKPTRIRAGPTKMEPTGAYTRLLHPLLQLLRALPSQSRKPCLQGDGGPASYTRRWGSGASFRGGLFYPYYHPMPPSFVASSLVSVMPAGGRYRRRHHRGRALKASFKGGPYKRIVYMSLPLLRPCLCLHLRWLPLSPGLP